MTRVALISTHGLSHALSLLLHQNGHDVHLWTPAWEPPGEHDVKAEALIEPADLADIPVVLVCSPFQSLSAVAQQISPYITGRHILVHCARSLSDPDGETGSQVMAHEVSTHKFGFLTGPIRAEEIEQGMSGAGVLASAFPEVHEVVQMLLVSDAFRLYRSKDLHGSELSASYARVIAFIVGVAEAMKQGASVRATLFARGLAEMGACVAAAGGQSSTVFGMSGTGNLFAGLQNPGDLAYNLGVLTVEHGRFDLDKFEASHGPRVREFWLLLDALSQVTASHGIKPHILSAARAIAIDGVSVQQAAAMLMELPALNE